jgi:hypothetical protein
VTTQIRRSDARGRSPITDLARAIHGPVWRKMNEIGQDPTGTGDKFIGLLSAGGGTLFLLQTVQVEDLLG